MKINWGTGIVVAFALFMTFILYFVIKVQSNSKYDNELVVEQYYQKDAHYGEDMVKFQNSKDLSEAPSVVVLEEGIKISFPETFAQNKILGKVSLYRPSNKKLDFETPLSLSNNTLLIPKKVLVGGRWDITLDWNYEGKPYLTKEQLVF